MWSRGARAIRAGAALAQFWRDSAQISRRPIPASRYHTLQLIHFYTCGADEVKCWTIRKGWKAPQAAGTIHTDFERGFIKAEVYSYADWKSLGGVDKVKEAGKYRTEGKEYVVNDGDIIFFKFNVTAEGKKK